MTEPRFDTQSVHKAFDKVLEDLELGKEVLLLMSDLVGTGQFYPIVVSFQLNEIQAPIDQVLGEAERLCEANPSASLVWSALALELFLKEGLLRPALLHRLSWDVEAFTELYRITVERNGGKVASGLLRPLTGLDLDQLKDSSGASLWQKIQDSESGVIALRNKIMHKGDVALPLEAVSALDVVKAFMKQVQQYFDGKKREIVGSIQRVELDDDDAEEGEGASP